MAFFHAFSHSKIYLCLQMILLMLKNLRFVPSLLLDLRVRVRVRVRVVTSLLLDLRVRVRVRVRVVTSLLLDLFLFGCAL